jgi:hypothetical protein
MRSVRLTQTSFEVSGEVAFKRSLTAERSNHEIANVAQRRSVRLENDS